jgi:integrase/recombinase XerD
MSDLLERMTMDMELIYYSPKTIKSYSYHVKRFLAYYDQKAEALDEDDIRKYLYMLKKERKLGQSNLIQAFSAIKFLYRSTLKMPMTLSKLRGPGRVQKLPVVLSKQELRNLFEVTTNLKHKTILMTTYAAGLRGSETAQLKVSDIDSQRMQIRVQQGKGSKDRYTLLSSVLLKQLRAYWREYKPQSWLFPSRDTTKPISASTILQIFKSSKKKPAYLNQPLFTL